MNYSECVSHDILMTVHSTKFIIIYLCQTGERDTIGRHYTKTLCSDFTGNWFFYKEKIKSSKEASISVQCRSRRPVTTISLSQILLVSSLFLLSIIFWRKGSIKLFITDKDEFIAEKMCWKDWPGKVEHQRLQTRLSWSWTWIKMRSGAVSPCISSRNTGELEHRRTIGNEAIKPQGEHCLSGHWINFYILIWIFYRI